MQSLIHHNLSHIKVPSIWLGLTLSVFCIYFYVPKQTIVVRTYCHDLIFAFSNAARYEYLETLDLRSSLSDWIGILHNHNNDISIRFFKILLPPSLLLVSLVNKGRRNLKHLALTENSQMKRFQAWQKGTRTSPFKNIPFSMNWISMKTLREWWLWWLVGQIHFKIY